MDVDVNQEEIGNVFWVKRKFVRIRGKSGNTRHLHLDGEGIYRKRDDLMLFLKKHAWWMLALVVGLGTSVLILDLTAPPPAVVEVPPPVIESSEPPKLVLRAPPLGETYGTGHWDGDQWHRTVPAVPEKISVDGEMLSYEELKKKMWRGTYPYVQRVIEEYPYSEAALMARYRIASDVWPDESLLLARYTEMLKYHPDSPRLLQNLAELTWENSPEEAIAYGKEALKYKPLYPEDTMYGLWAESVEIHNTLGMAYQQAGDYKSALVHLKTTKNLLESNNVQTDQISYDVVNTCIEYIEKGSPLWGPVPHPDLDVSAESIVDFSSMPPLPTDVIDVPVDASVGSDFLPPPVLEDPVSEVPINPSESEALRVDAVKQARETFIEQQQEIQQEFEDFLRWLETIEKAKSPSDLEGFLMREMAKYLQGESTQFESERVLRAHEVLDRFGEKEGLKRLEHVDPELAREIRRQRPPIPKK